MLHELIQNKVGKINEKGRRKKVKKKGHHTSQIISKQDTVNNSYFYQLTVCVLL